MKYRRQYADGGAAIAMTVAPGVAFQIEEVRVHLSAAGGAGDLTITLDSGEAADHDVVLLTQDMTLVVDLAWQPTRPLSFRADDEVDIEYANANTRDYGVEVIYSAI